MELVIVEVPKNMFILHLLDLVFNIPKWNAKVDNYVASIFKFVNKYLTGDGRVLFFYNDNFFVLRHKVLKENYNFKIYSKFIVINKMHQKNLEFSTKR
jgi:hypothetical protein